MGAKAEAYIRSFLVLRLSGRTTINKNITNAPTACQKMRDDTH